GTLDLNRALNLNLISADARDLAHKLDKALALTRAYTRDLARALNNTGDLISVFTNASARAFDLASILSSSRANTRARALASALASARDLARIYDHCFRYQPPQSSRATLVNKILESDIDWQLTPTQLDTFGIYVSSTYRALECLDVAAVEDRVAILNQL